MTDKEPQEPQEPQEPPQKKRKTTSEVNEQFKATVGRVFKRAAAGDDVILDRALISMVMVLNNVGMKDRFGAEMVAHAKHLVLLLPSEYGPISYLRFLNPIEDPAALAKAVEGVEIYTIPEPYTAGMQNERTAKPIRVLKASCERCVDDCSIGDEESDRVYHKLHIDEYENVGVDPEKSELP